MLSCGCVGGIAQLVESLANTHKAPESDPPAHRKPCTPSPHSGDEGSDVQDQLHSGFKTSLSQKKNSPLGLALVGQRGQEEVMKGNGRCRGHTTVSV